MRAVKTPDEARWTAVGIMKVKQMENQSVSLVYLPEFLRFFSHSNLLSDLWIGNVNYEKKFDSYGIEI